MKIKNTLPYRPTLIANSSFASCEGDGRKFQCGCSINFSAKIRHYTKPQMLAVKLKDRNNNKKMVTRYI